MEIKDSHLPHVQDQSTIDASLEKRTVSPQHTSPSASIHVTVLDGSIPQLLQIEEVGRKILDREGDFQGGKRIVGNLISIEHAPDLHDPHLLSQTVLFAQREVDQMKQEKEIQEDRDQYATVIKEEQEDEALEEINIKEIQETEVGEDLVQKRIDDEEKGKAPYNPSPKPL